MVSATEDTREMRYRASIRVPSWKCQPENALWAEISQRYGLCLLSIEELGSLVPSATLERSCGHC